MGSPSAMDDNQLQALYQWVDEVPLTRPKRNIARDFSDGVLMAEMVKHYFPRLVELHNYSGTQSVAQKIYNWNTLDRKVFKKIDFLIAKEEIDDITNCVPGAIEKVLSNFKTKVAQMQNKKLHEQAMQRAQQQHELAPPQPPPPLTPGATEVQSAATMAAAPSRTASAAGNKQQQATPRSTATTAAADAALREALLERNTMSQIIIEKDATIAEMKETIEILEAKNRKLEELVKIKDQKIAALKAKLPR